MDKFKEVLKETRDNINDSAVEDWVRDGMINHQQLSSWDVKCDIRNESSRLGGKRVIVIDSTYTPYETTPCRLEVNFDEKHNRMVECSITVGCWEMFTRFDNPYYNPPYELTYYLLVDKWYDIEDKLDENEQRRLVKYVYFMCLVFDTLETYLSW